MIMKENKIRNKQVNVRLTEAEYRRLDEAAQASGLGGGRLIFGWYCTSRGSVREPKKKNRNGAYCTSSHHNGADASAVGGNRFCIANAIRNLFPQA